MRVRIGYTSRVGKRPIGHVIVGIVLVGLLGVEERVRVFRFEEVPKRSIIPREQLRAQPK